MALGASRKIIIEMPLCVLRSIPYIDMVYWSKSGALHSGAQGDPPFVNSGV